MKKLFTFNLKSLLLMCLMMVGVNAWAAPGDEIKSPNDVVSGKSYYIKGVSTVSKKETTFYFTASTYGAGKIGESGTPNTTTDFDRATPVTFTKSGNKWSLITPSGLYIRPHSSNGQMYLVEDALSYELVSCDTKEGANKGMKIGPFVSGTDNWYIQVPTSAQKIGGYKTDQYGVTLIEAGETSGKTETSLSFGEGSPFTVNIGESFTAPTLTATPSSILSSVTYSSSNTSVAEVSSTTGAVTIKGLGTTTIKAKYEGDDDYLGSTAEYVINVVDPDAITATFDLSTNQYGWATTGDGNVYFDGSTYEPATEGDITLSVSGNVRMWGTTTSSLRLYGDNAGSDPNIYKFGRGAITLKAAEGYVITSVKFEGSNLTFEPSEGTYTSPMWAGEANEVTFEKGSNTPQIKAITVDYKLASGPVVTTKYNVTIDADIENGTVTADKATAAEGEKVALTITPNEGYVLAMLIVSTEETGEEVEVAEGNTFTMPAADVNVYAAFAPAATETYTLSQFAEAGIAPGSMVSISFDNEIVEIIKDDESAMVALKDGENIFVLIAEETCSSDWEVGGTLTGTWTAMYGGLNPMSGSYMLYFQGENAWADLTYSGLQLDEFVFIFAANATATDLDSNASWEKTSDLNKVFAVGYQHISSIAATNNVYPARNSLVNGAKFGTTKAAGSISFTLKNPIKGATYIVVSAAPYGDEEGQQGFKVNGTNVSMATALNKAYCDYLIKLDGSDLSTITLTQKEANKGRIYVEYIKVLKDAPQFLKNVVKLPAKGEDAYYATFSSNKVTFFPEDYTVSAVGVENGQLYQFDNDEAFDEDIVEITGKDDVIGYYVPANTGVLIASPKNVVTYYTAEGVTPSTDVEAVNMLQPASKVKTGDFKFYKLAYEDETKAPASLGFYWGAEDGAAFDSREGSAYLAVPATAANVKGFRLVEDDATAIKNVANNKVKTNAVYNLAGQRVADKNFKGIVIKNGKKMLNK